MIMMIRLFVLVGLFFFWKATSVAQTNANLQWVQTFFQERKEVFFKFDIQSREELETLTRMVSIDHRTRGKEVFAYANQKQFEKFLSLGYDYSILKSPGDKAKVRMMDVSEWEQKSSCNQSWDFYPTYELYEEMLFQFEEDHPDICRMVVIGELPSGRKLLAAKITDHPDLTENEPRFLYTSTMHGDETTGFPLMLRLINHLLCNYGTDDRITHLVDNIEIWINPLANPDGTYTNDNSTISGATRSNANGYDLNRNYPDPDDGPHPDGGQWQPETLAFMAFAEGNHFNLSCNIHGGAEVANYPWDTWFKRHADDAWWRHVCREYADTAHAFSPFGYFNDLQNGITNGFDWFTVAGGRQDYMTYFNLGREFTLEISNIKTLPASQLPAFWEYNYRSFLNYLEQSLFGLRGIVTDSLSGEPLAALVFMENFDKDSSHVRTQLPVGDYHRYLKAGNYDLTFSASGYIPKTIKNVQIVDNEPVVLNVPLVRDDIQTATSEPGKPFPKLKIFSNPVRETLSFEMEHFQGIPTTIQLIGLNGRIMQELSLPSPTSKHFISLSMDPFSPGVYFLKTAFPGGAVVKKILLQ